MNIMLKQVLKGLLRKHLNEFVEGAGDLNLAVDKGNIVLQNLLLKENALEWTEMPLKVKRGSSVEKLTLIIPWGKIKKKPTILKVDNVDIELTMDWMDDAEKVLERLQSIKRRQIELHEIYEKELLENNATSGLGASGHSRTQSDSTIGSASKPVHNRSSSSIAAPSTSSDTTTMKKKSHNLVSSYLEAVVENLHVEISNLKIKYKEKDGIAFFIHLEHLVFQNCNESWDPISTAASDHSDQIFKFGSVDNFSITFERNKPKMYNNISHYRKNTRHHHNNNRSNSPVNNASDVNSANIRQDYVVEPLSIITKIKKNKDANLLSHDNRESVTKKNGTAKYKYHVDINCKKISFKLQPYQIKEIKRLSDSINVSEFYVLHLFMQKHRPSESPSKNPKAWWKYAIRYVQAVINPGKFDLPSLAYKRRRISWVALLKLLADQQKYIKLIKRKAGAPWLAKFVETKDVALLEDKFTFEQIVLFRRLAKAELDYERKLYESKSHGTNVRKVLNMKRTKDKSKHMIKDSERLELYASFQENEGLNKQKRELYDKTQVVVPFFDINCNFKSILISLTKEEEDTEDEKIILNTFLTIKFGEINTSTKLTSQSLKTFIPGGRGGSLVEVTCNSIACFDNMDGLKGGACSLISMGRSDSIETGGGSNTKHNDRIDFKNESIFYFHFEKFEPNTKPVDVCVRGEAKSLDFYIEQDLLKCLLVYFSRLDNESSTNSVQHLTRELLVKQSRSQLQATIEAHLRYDINIKTGALCVIVPTVFSDSSSKTFVLSLGSSTFQSKLKNEDESYNDDDNNNKPKSIASETGDENMSLTETYVLNTTDLGIKYFSMLSEWKSSISHDRGEIRNDPSNIILKSFNFDSTINVSMVPSDDIVPWVQSISTIPVMCFSISPTHIESISYLHSRIIEDENLDNSTERRSQSIGSVPVGFKNLISTTTPPRRKNDETIKNRRKHKLKLHGDSSENLHSVGNSEEKKMKQILGRVYFSHQFNVEGVDVELQENHDILSTFMSINVRYINLNTHIRLADSLLESSIKNIKVVDMKTTENWENGVVFEVTDSTSDFVGNTNNASSALHVSLFLCKTFSCNFIGYENNFDFNVSNVLLNWNNETLSRIVSAMTYISDDSSSLNNNMEVNRILNKYARRANGAIRNSTSVKVSCSFDTIDANVIKLEENRCIVKLVLKQATLVHAKLQNGNEQTLSCIQDFSIVDTSILGMNSCPTRTGTFKMLPINMILGENDLTSPVEVFHRRKDTTDAILNVEIIKSIREPGASYDVSSVGILHTSEEQQHRHNDELSIRVRAGAFKFIFMNTLIIEVVDYIDAGITGAIASFVAHEASIALDDIYARNQIVKVEANIDHPLIIFPSIRHSYRATKDDSLKLDLGHVELKSKLNADKTAPEEDYTSESNNNINYDITVSNARLFSCSYNTLVQNWVDEVQMVDDFNAIVDLTVSPSGWDESYIEEFAEKGYYVDGVERKIKTWIFTFVTHIDEVVGTLSQSQFASIENLLEWNLKDWRQSRAVHATPFLPLFAEASQAKSYRNVMEGRPVFLTLEFKINKGNIVLERGFGKHVCNNAGNKMQSGTDNTLASLFIFEASDLQIKIENFIGRVIRNLVTTQSVTMYDPRLQNDGERVSGEIFSTKSQNQNEELVPVLVEILRHPAGDKEHRINILNPKVIIHVFSAERLTDFFSRCHDFDSKDRAFIRSRNRDTASVFSFKIMKAHVRLVECSASDTPIHTRAATVFAGNLSVTIAGNRELGIKVKCETHQSKILVQFEKSLVEHLIVKEVNCLVDFSQTVLSSSVGNFYWGNNEVIHIHRQVNLKLSDISLTIGVPHLLIMSNIFQTINEGIITINESKLDTEDSLIKVGFSAIVNMTHARAIIVSDCYNKGNTIPILRLRLSNCFFKISESGDDGSQLSLDFFDTNIRNENVYTDSSSKLRTGVSIYFYNTRVVTWEPLLEPWRFSIEMFLPPMSKNKDHASPRHSQRGKAEEIKIRSQEDLCINVSHSFLKSFKLWWDSELSPTLNAMETASNSNNIDSDDANDINVGMAKMRIEPSPTVHHEYVLENASGLPLKFALSYQGDSEMIEVENGASVPFSFPETLIHEHWYENPWANLHTTAIKVKWDLPSKPLEKIQIEKIGKYVYKLQPYVVEDSEETFNSELAQLFLRREWNLPEILCDVSSQGGSLVVRLSALTRVVNTTETVLEVLLCGGPDAGIIQKLSPGGSISLPIHLQLHGRLTARPFSDENNNVKEYSWWQGIDLFPLFESSSTNKTHIEKMTCHVMDGDDEDKKSWVSYVEFEKIKTADLKGYYYDLKFVSPITITNALPYPLYIKVRRGNQSRREIFSTYLQPGDSTHMNTASLRSYDLLLVLSFNGLEWSDEEHLESWIESVQKKSFFKSRVEKKITREPAESIYVPTRTIDRETGLLSMDKINLSMDNVDRGTSRKLVIYCRYWLINRSMLPLSFETPKNESKKQSRNKAMDDFSSTRRLSMIGKPSEIGIASEIFSGTLEPQACDDSDKKDWDANYAGSSEAFEKTKPILYSSADRIRVAVEGTEHCRFFSINAVGANGFISCVEKQSSAISRMLQSASKRRGVTGYLAEDTRRRLFELGVSLRVAPGKFNRTTMVIFSPRYVIVNRLRQPIYVTQANMQKRFTHTTTKKTLKEDILADDMITLEPNEGKPFHWFNVPQHVNDTEELQLSFRLSADGWRWSGGVVISDIRGMAIKLRNDITNTNFVARIEIKSEDTTSYVLISEENPEVPLYRIVNRSNEFIHFKQKQQKNSSSSYVMERILPGDEKVFGWDEPCEEDRSMVISNSSGLGQIEYRLDEIRMKKYLYTADSGKKISGSNRRRKKTKISVFTEIHGPTKVLILSDNNFTTESRSLSITPPIGNATNIGLNTPKHTYNNEKSNDRKPLSTVTHDKDYNADNDYVDDTLTALPPSRQIRSESMESDTSMQSSTLDNKEVVEADYCSRSLTLGLQNAKICLIDSQPIEIALISLVHVVVAHNSYYFGDNSVEILIKDLQVDNQLTDTLFPVLLTPIPRQLKKKPFFHVSLAKPYVSENVDFYSYIAVLIQAFQVSIDQNSLMIIAEFVLSCLDVFNGENINSNKSKEGRDNNDSSGINIGERDRDGRAEFIDLQLKNTLFDALSLHKNEGKRGSRFHHIFNPLKQIYVQLMHLHPIKIRLKFAATRDAVRNRHEIFQEKKDILPPSVKSLLVDIDNASIRMNAMLHTDVFVNVETLLTSIRNHYIGQARADLYRIIGAVDVLGNPVGFVRGLGTGMVDFFYEPAQGLIKSPGAFGLGVAKGTYSLVSGIVGGALHSASKLTGGVGSGIAQLSFDGDYKHKRKISKHVENPTNMAEGVIYGTKAMGEGILLGVSGLVTQPYKGAKLEGAKGFLKGFAKGVIGVAVKPTVGVLDGASNITQGISGTATSLMSKPRTIRLRRPRLLYSPDRILVIYREEQAFVKHLMEQVVSTKIDTKLYFAPQEYVTHVALPRAKLMLVTRHLVSVWSCQTFLDGLDQSPNVSWITSLAHIQDIQIASNGKAICIICKSREIKKGAKKGKRMSLQLLIPSLHEEITAAVLQRLHTIINQSKGV